MSAEESESEREEAEAEVQEGEEVQAEDGRKGKRYFVRRNTQASTAYTNAYTDAHTPSAPPSPYPQPAQVEITMRDLENAIHTINKFASLYRRAVSAIENLERAENLFERRMGGRTFHSQSLGRFFGIPSSSSYNDPITTMLMEAVEQAVKEQAQKIVKKRAEKLVSASEGESESEEVREALEGLRESERESESGSGSGKEKEEESESDK